jgi:dTDP-4-amino-4,6-dideoxy-D-galactose acyltransferase
MSDVEPLCERLDWDSRFFGVSIARALPTRVDAATCDAILAWCRAQHIDCLYFLADDEADVKAVLERAGFVGVDCRVTLERAVVAHAAPAVPAGVRCARPSDVPALRDIAAVSHRDTRFYADLRFDRSRCDELYRTWIERSCAGWADCVVVVEHEDTPAGYLTLHLRTPGTAAIGLLAVSPDYQRQGVASRLVDGAIAWLQNRSITSVSVVTQGRNDRSLAFYQSAGFRISATASWYHHWFSTTQPTER